MKSLYIDCSMGAAGDMLTAALLELLPDPDAAVTELNALGIPSVRFSTHPSTKCGIMGTHVSVKIHGREEIDHEQLHGHEHEYPHEHEHPHEHGHSLEHGHPHEHRHSQERDHSHEHSHRSMHQIGHILEKLPISQSVREHAISVYDLIAQAESSAHGVPVSEIHFHEVGTMDAVADVTAVCLLMEKLAPDEVIVSPIHVGSGQVACAHGILPIPAPATAHILRGAPIYGGSIQGELCTPTGAALLRHFATRFGDMPVMQVEKIGYGMGVKDFSAANCVRTMIGESSTGMTETVWELQCQVDDMTAEMIGFAAERLLEGGALDVFSVPVGMKKSRPGTLLSVLCREQEKETILSLLFRHTTTLGIRETKQRRHYLARTIETHDTPFGPVREKISSGYGVTRSKLEYEDLAHIAKKYDISIEELKTRLNIG